MGTRAAPPLPRAWYARDARVVARELLGCVLARDVDGRTLRARIVETEAYLGPHDLAAHSRSGRTARNAAMFGPPGRAYVYLVYGLHHCANVVCGDHDGQAVLLRAAEPLGWNADLGGPARLARHLAIDRGLDGHDLGKAPLWLEPGPPPARVRLTPRIGVDYAGSWARRKLRFVAR